MDYNCFYNCVTSPSNILVLGSAVILTMIALLVYQISKSYKLRITSLYFTLGLIPFSITFVLGNLPCGSSMSCTSNTLEIISYGIMAAIGFLGIVYYFFGAKLCIRAINGKYIERSDYPEIYESLDEICAKIGIKTPKIVYVDSGKPTALSISGSKNIILLSIGSMEMLNDIELKAVLAHEVAHLKSQDPLTKFVSKLFGVSYLYGFALAKNLEKEQEKRANEIAERIVGKDALRSAISKFRKN